MQRLAAVLARRCHQPGAIVAYDGAAISIPIQEGDMADTRKPGRGQRTGVTKARDATAANAPPVQRASSSSSTAKRTATRSRPSQPQPIVRDDWIRVAAYYRAERRGFVPGHELEDWF